MQVEIWSDIACPWCYIGKRRFEGALARFAGRDDVSVTWRSFELDPSAAADRDMSHDELLMGKYGMSADEARAANERVSTLAAAEGLAYDMAISRPGNTFDGHRLVHLAASHGLQDAMKERLLRAYFGEGHLISDQATLVELAVEVGLDAGEVRAALESGAHAEDVRADEAMAGRLGIQGVPFYVVDGRYGVSGAQPVEQLLEVLETAAREPAVG